MVAEPGNVLAPFHAPHHATPCLRMLALLLLMIGGRVELDHLNISNDVDEKEEELTVLKDMSLETKEDRNLLSRWPEKHFQMMTGLTESLGFGFGWIGATCEDGLTWMGAMLLDEPGSHDLGEWVEPKSNYSLAEVKDWNLDLNTCPRFVIADGSPIWREVGDRCPDLRVYDGRSLQDVEYSLNLSMNLDEDVDFPRTGVGSYVVSFLLEPYVWMLCGVVQVLLCLRARALTIQETNKEKKKEFRLHMGHLSFARKRRWNGSLRSRFESRVQMKSFVFLMLWASSNAMDAEQTRQVLTRMMQMSEAATLAAQASSALMEKWERKKDNGNFGEASKVLRNPDLLEGDDPLKYASWKEQFTNWLVYGDSRFGELLRDVENLDEPCQLSDFASDDVRSLAHRLYAILASYVKGPAQQLIRAEAGEKNGFLVWQQLRNLYMPKAIPRTMAIGQAIMALPSFPRDRGMLENLLQLDLLLDQYRLASGHPMPDDLVVSTVLRCVDPSLRRHLEMTLDDTVNYESLKEKLVLLDKNVRVWSGDSYLKMVQSSMSSSSGGPVPMEVDQVGQISKGKYKGKAKGKDKKGSAWFPFGYGGKQGGKAFKGKGKKGKGKKGKKGKSKGGGFGKGKGGGQDRNTCRVCGQQGHWGNECPNRNRAQTVMNAAPPVNSSVAESEIASSAGGKARTSGASSTASTTAYSGKPQVRQVKLYHVATPKSETQSPVLFDLKSEGGDSWIYNDNYQVSTVYFVVGDESDFEEADLTVDKTTRWYTDAKVIRYSIAEEEMKKDGVFQVCTVSEANVRTLIVLDSGADSSLLPQTMANCGRPSTSGKAVLEDAQGGRLQTFGKKLAQIECDGGEETVIIEDYFVVASVQCPLVSLGRLLQRGWKLAPGSGEAGVHLHAPDGACSIPLHFKRNSLALYGTISRVCQEPGEVHGEGGAKTQDDDEVLVIRVILKLNEEFWTHYGLRAWRTTKDGNPMRFCYETKNFVDGQLMWNLNWWPLRSTLIRKLDDTWELVEHCARYYTNEEPDGEILECGGMETQTLTILHRKKEPISFFGTVIGEQTATGGGIQVDSDDFQFSGEPNVPFELTHNRKCRLRRLSNRMQKEILGMVPYPCLRTKMP